MGEEEVSVDVVNSGDDQNKDRLTFKLKRCGPHWVPQVTAREPCAKKQAKQGLKDAKEQENSSGQKEQPKEVSCVDKCCEVLNSKFCPKENSSCHETTILRFKLKRQGPNWVPEVTAREPCSKKQAKQGLKYVKKLENSVGQKEQPKEVSYVEKFFEVSNPNFSPIENVSCQKTSSSRKRAKKVSDDQSEISASDNQDETRSTCSWNTSTEESLSDELGQNAVIDKNCCSQYVLENQSHDSITVVRKIDFRCSKKREEYNNQISANLTDSFLTNVEELLSTGFLEGARVKYVFTSGNVKLWGIIKDGGFRCSCSICIFSKVLSAHEFELHAGGKSRHPHNHIYLDNGNSIYSIIQELRTTPLNMLEEVIKRVAGSSVNEEHLWTWKASLHQNNELATTVDNCYGKFPGMHSTGQYTEVIQRTDGPSRSCVQNEPFDQKSCMDALGGQKCMIHELRSDFSGSVREQKRNTVGHTKKRGHDLHRLLFLPKGLQDGTKLAYRVRGKDMLKGYKQGNGIVCSHCDTKISPSQFEAHAGCAARRQPYRHIFTTNGHTLHEIALQLSNGQSIVPSGSDDKCAVCGVGGELIVCVGCSRPYHAVCLGLEDIPTGDWHCSCCTENIGPEGKDFTPVILQPVRVVKPPVYQPGGSVVCRAQDLSVDTSDERKVMQCYQCGKQYHDSCLSDIGLCDSKNFPKGKWFCCSDCNRIHLTMQSLLEVNKVLPTSVLDALNVKHIGKGLTDGAADSMHWRILSGKSSSAKDSPLLLKAAAIFNECFKPIRTKTCRDLIAAVVHGKNISEQESRQFYCVVLIVDSVVSSAGILRIISREMAELPIVATRKKYREKLGYESVVWDCLGYFRALFSVIEHLLVSMNVEKVVLPAAKDAESMWTSKLGFKKISDERLSEYTTDFQLTMFAETSMLEKLLGESNCKSKVVETTSQLADSSRT